MVAVSGGGSGGCGIADSGGGSGGCSVPEDRRSNLGLEEDGAL